ncbi:hypothetical protein AB0C21_03415 [Spirillospora sp. NPDC049024]
MEDWIDMDFQGRDRSVIFAPVRGIAINAIEIKEGGATGHGSGNRSRVRWSRAWRHSHDALGGRL